jgi:predicted nucleotidyltransferase
VIVYGSAARGGLRSGGDYPSDVDIGVAAEAELALERRLSLAAQLAIALDREVDLVDLRRAHGTILREILTTGHFIRNVRPEFIAEKASEMYDYQLFLEPVLERARAERIRRFTARSDGGPHT